MPRYFWSNLFGRVIFHSHLPKLDSLRIWYTRARITMPCPLIQIDQFCRKQWNAKVKRIEKLTHAYRASEGRRVADIISANCEAVNCGKREPVKAINANRTATASSNFFFGRWKTANGIPSELSQFDFLARSRTARAAKCYFRVRADHLCVSVWVKFAFNEKIPRTLARSYISLYNSDKQKVLYRLCERERTYAEMLPGNVTARLSCLSYEKFRELREISSAAIDDIFIDLSTYETFAKIFLKRQ